MVSLPQYSSLIGPDVITMLISDWSRSRAELESVAEDYHRGLASLEFSHYNLKSEYDKVGCKSIMSSI